MLRIPLAASPARGAGRFSLRLLPASGLVPLLLLLGLFAPALTGCEDTIGLDLDGEFVADVSGDVALSDSLKGDAYYTVFDGEDGPRFVLLFFRGDLNDNDEDAYSYIALWRQSTRPGVGVYPVESTQTSDDAFLGSYTDLVDAETPDAAGPVVSATTGVLTITDYDTGELTGSFRFDGQGLFLPDTGTFITAAVDGTFEARYLSPDIVRSLSIDFDFD